ncbi:MAG: TetR/AcrR family transcriptional regulator [Muribaculaceae bacterium]|nr:TetR/AcrR family transcriptional regulator [Muribaculaceae bacterium]
MNPSSNKEQLLDEVYKILIEKGIKSTTMDSVARKLKISKRTLYEIFDNKQDLVKQALEHHTTLHRIACEQAMASAGNIMEGLLAVTKLHRDDLRNVSIEFFRDMDRLYPTMREDYEKRRTKMRQQLLLLFQAGVNQGVFRKDTNFNALTYIIEVWMESMKRMEKNLPDDLNLVDIFDTMTLTFARTIASPLGMEMLDRSIHTPDKEPSFPTLTDAELSEHSRHSELSESSESSELPANCR